MFLSENHKRAVSSTLRIIEKRIDEIALLITNDKKGSSFIVINDLNENENELTLKLCAETKFAIANLFLKYSLPLDEIILSHVINASRAFIWKDLVETDSKSLAHYGEFTPDENPNELEKDVKHILSLTEKLVNETNK